MIDATASHAMPRGQPPTRILARVVSVVAGLVDPAARCWATVINAVSGFLGAEAVRFCGAGLSRFRVVPHGSSIALLYPKGDPFVHSSLCETVGLTPLEAMVCGA